MITFHEIKNKLHFFSLLSGLFGGFLTLSAILEMTPNFIISLSQTPVAGNVNTIASLSSQKTDLLIGLVFVLIALLIEIFDWLIPNKLFSRSFKTFMISVIIYVLILISVFCYLRPAISSRYKRQVCKILVEEKIENNSIDSNDYNSIEFLASNLIGKTRLENETKKEFLIRVARSLNISIDIEIRIN